MSSIWLVGGVAFVVAAVAVVARWLRAGPRRDLGSVSSNWISEHRLGSNQDSSPR